jgi:hypothetical protein
MKTRLVLFLFHLFLVPLGFAESQTPVPLSQGVGVTMTNGQWKIVIAQFEDSVFSLSGWLAKGKAEKKKNQDEIAKLEKKIASLREDTSKNSNVFGEIRLKGLLNDLKEKLQENSAFQRQWDEKQKEFEQKALSLTTLYNDRIELGLESADPTDRSPRLHFEIIELASFIQKRNQILSLLKEYERENDQEKPAPVVSLNSLKTNDRENLQLALDLLRDRKKELEERMEKLALEEDEIKNELKLQGKMQEFLEDIHQMNEDSNFPRGNLKRNDLAGVAGKNQKTKLGNHLAEVRGKMVQGQKRLTQINQLLDQVERQIDSSTARKEP